MLGIIPARGGSKGISNKNIKELAGKPLLAYTIDAALQSGIFKKVIVSTDSKEIADVARKYGAEVPFLRPHNISGDEISSDAVILHALQFYEIHNLYFEEVCKLQPTSPLRTAQDLSDAYQIFRQGNWSFLVSVCECEHSPLWSGTLDNQNTLDDFLRPEVIQACRQKLPKYYRLNGAVYMAKANAFLKAESFFGKNGTAYIMSQEKSIDIDSYLDFSIAELILNNIKNNV
ncbi:MAG: acylneuraminate cytidylyltransferase family protein [Lachnospiraceae bacterium]|nr:acylneuraminate cytidylyltransferase family protein [Lachnospiraceae bacterium]